MHRPVFARQNSEGFVYRVEAGGGQAVRVPVVYGAVSVNTIEIRSGLAVGDKVILSDMTGVKEVERVNLK
jgi:hypothetical protein